MSLTPYEEKFAGFISMCKKVKEQNIDIVLVAYPQVLGDSYEELVESLNRLAEAGLTLAIAGPQR